MAGIVQYHYSRKVKAPFDAVIDKITAGLQQQGFGVLTTIDVKDTFRKKLDKDFRNYKILGACNPQFAYKALAIEPTIGVMLPCNIAVQEEQDGVLVSAINPLETMGISVKNPDLEHVASEVSNRLRKVVDELA